jgi:hypothetical protein
VNPSVEPEVLVRLAKRQAARTERGSDGFAKLWVGGSGQASCCARKDRSARGVFVDDDADALADALENLDREVGTP